MRKWKWAERTSKHPEIFAIFGPLRGRRSGHYNEQRDDDSPVKFPYPSTACGSKSSQSLTLARSHKKVECMYCSQSSMFFSPSSCKNLILHKILFWFAELEHLFLSLTLRSHKWNPMSVSGPSPTLPLFKDLLLFFISGFSVFVPAGARLLLLRLANFPQNEDVVSLK